MDKKIITTPPCANPAQACYHTCPLSDNTSHVYQFLPWCYVSPATLARNLQAFFAATF